MSSGRAPSVRAARARVAGPRAGGRRAASAHVAQHARRRFALLAGLVHSQASCDPRLGRERMAPQSSVTAFETLPSGGRVHVLGAGPVGLLLTALLQSMEGLSVRLYEKRREYTRTRMVQLAPYLV